MCNTNIKYLSIVMIFLFLFSISYALTCCGTTSCSCGASGYCDYNCISPYKNCDGISSNGCETNTNTDNNNCGSCGNVCSPPTTCVNGVCVEAIQKGEEDPLHCYIPYLINSNNITISCNPRSNTTGQPLLGLTINCKLWNYNMSNNLSNNLAMSEKGYGLYILNINNLNNTCYFINCSTSIEGVVNNFGNSICILNQSISLNLTNYSYSLSCPSCPNLSTPQINGKLYLLLSITFISMFILILLRYSR
jgi:hypothetical protein